MIGPVCNNYAARSIEIRIASDNEVVLLPERAIRLWLRFDSLFLSHLKVGELR